MTYVGRFAPSPSGDLHLGSLVTALGSYLQAKKAQGEWLVRIEDIDPFRETQQAATRILYTLEHIGLHWDRSVIYQSQRIERYQHWIDELQKKQVVYYCDCTRKRVAELGGHYDNYCRNRQISYCVNQTAIRLQQQYPILRFNDNRLDNMAIDSSIAYEDYILRRKDGFFAYNFVVVIDDHDQGVTEVVRGADLLECTGKQISLYKQFNWQPPEYLHLPLVTDPLGYKLSKQNHAEGINIDDIIPVLAYALQLLGQPLPVSWQDATKEELLVFAIKHWNIDTIPTDLPPNKG